MASRFFLLFLLCATQSTWYADAANPTQMATDAISQLLAPLQAPLQNAMAQAQQLVQILKNLQNLTLTSSAGPLQKLVQNVADFVKNKFQNSIQYVQNTTSCATGQVDHARSITEQAAKNLFGCTQTQIEIAVVKLSDVTSLNNQAVEVFRDGVAQLVGCLQHWTQGCILNVNQVVTSKMSMLTSAVASDLATLTVQGVNLPRALFQCGVDQIAKATSQVGALISDMGTCMDKVAQNS